MGADGQWRGVVNQIVYGLIFAKRLDDAVVDDVARNIVARGTLRASPEVYREAITRALASATLEDPFDTPHTEAELRDFLARLGERLDQLRPWPEPRFTKVDISEWPSFEGGRAIARIERTKMQVEASLREAFDRLPIGDGGLSGLILALPSGRTVALLGRSGVGNRVILLQREPGDPAATIAAFREATGLPEDEVAPLTGERSTRDAITEWGR
jgi:hypothetical protein